MLKNKTLEHLLFGNSRSNLIRQRTKPRIYDPYFIQLSFIRRMFLRLIRKSSVKSILDLGCGERHFSEMLKNTEIRYTAVDSFAEAPEIIRRDLEQPFSLGRFDFIICSEVMEHIFEHRQLVENILGNLAPAGVVFITVPFAYEVHGWGYHDYYRFTDQCLSRLFSGAAEVHTYPSNTYLTSMLQRVSNLLFYFPVPYVFKVPFFAILNVSMVLLDSLARGLLKVAKVKPSSILYKLTYSYPLNYACIARFGGNAGAQELKTLEGE